jgi:uncharacterized protein
MITMQNFRQAIADYISEQAKPQEKFGHQPRLYELTRQVGKGQTYDDDVVYAAAWLHDLGVFTGHRPEDLQELQHWDNTAYAMEKTPDLLVRFGFPTDKTAAVVEAIRTHQPSKQPTSTEGEILRDADILEQLGAIAVLRTVCKIGRDTRFPDFTAATHSLEKALTTLPGQLHLGTSRALAEERIKTLRHFLASVRQEAGSALY